MVRSQPASASEVWSITSVSSAIGTRIICTKKMIAIVVPRVGPSTPSQIAASSTAPMAIVPKMSEMVNSTAVTRFACSWVV